MRVVSVTILALVAAASLGQAQTDQALGGRVVDGRTGRPLEAVQAILLPVGLSTVSDVDGRFAFPRMAVGRYTLRLVRLGYAADERTVTLAQGGPTALEIGLEPRAEQLAGITVVGPGEGSLVRIPGAAAVIDRAQLDQTLALSGNEVFRLVPGVHVQDEEGMGFRANIGVRGLDPDRSRTVLVLEDGVPVALAPYGEPEMYYTPPIDRMERVEVIKGSGSILFGPQTIGGVVNYVTPEPPARPEGGVKVLGGSGGFAMGRLTYGGSWNGARALLGILRRQARDLRGLFFHQTDATAKVALDVGPRDVVSVKLNVYDELSNSTYVGLTDSIFRANPSYYAAPDDRLRIRRYGLTLAHEHGVGEGDGGARSWKTTVYGYQTTRDWQRQEYAYTGTGNNYVWRNSTGNRNRSFEVLGIEPRVRVEHRLGALEAGVRAHTERARDQHINGRTATSRTGEIRDDEIRTGYALAAFVQNRFEAAARVRFTPGLRVEYFSYGRHILRTRVRREVRDSAGAVVGVTHVPEDVDLRSGDALFEAIPGVGVSWLASDRLTLFAGAHRGFAPPRVKDALVYQDDTLPPGQEPGDPVSLRLDAERSWNLELGMRGQPLPGVFLEATAFYLDFSNQIIEPSFSAGAAGQVALANQGQTRHRGVEGALAVDWGVVARWRVSLRTEVRYTYADARFSRDRLMVDPVGDTVNVRGNRLPYAPAHLVAVSATLAAPGRGSLRLDGARVSEQFADNFETQAVSANGRTGVIPPYAVWNAAGAFTVPGTRLRVLGTVKNLLGSVYIASRRPEGIKPGLFRQADVGVELAF